MSKKNIPKEFMFHNKDAKRSHCLDHSSETHRESSGRGESRTERPWPCPGCADADAGAAASRSGRTRRAGRGESLLWEAAATATAKNKLKHNIFLICFLIYIFYFALKGPSFHSFGKIGGEERVVKKNRRREGNQQVVEDKSRGIYHLGSFIPARRCIESSLPVIGRSLYCIPS